MDVAEMVEAWVRVYLALFFTAVAVFYTVRILYRQRQTGQAMVFAGQCMDRSWWAHRCFRLFRLLIWLVCLLRWPYPALDSYLGYWPALASPALLLAGCVLLAAGFALAMAGHFSLGRDWRCGIDPQGPERLHQQGLYAISRNPMFAGVHLAQIGLLLALPSWFSLVCLLVGWLAVALQLRVEEEFLQSRFADDYRQYCRQTPRWLSLSALLPRR